MSEREPQEENSRARIEAQYDKFAEHVRELFQTSQEKSREALEKAADAARENLRAAGEFTTEQGALFKKYLLRDLERAREVLGQYSQEAAVRLHPERLRAGALSSLSALLQSAGERLQSWSRKTDEALICEVGEITSAGTLTCLNCGHTMHLSKTGHIPPCPECYQGRFRKTY